MSFIQETLEKRLSSCQNVWFCYCTGSNQYRNLCFVHKTTYLWSMRSPGGGVSAYPGVGNRLPSESKVVNPRGYARGGGGEMVTGRIEPCISNEKVLILNGF